MKRLLLSLAIVAPLATAALQEPISVEGGQITGTPAWGWGVRLYRGIPYAAPPVGNLRWSPPQSVAPWKGVLAADQFSAACMQTPRDQNNIGWRDGLIPVSEDCLYLNVWTPAKSAQDKLPVMVWIHGGGWTSGSGAETAWAGDNLAKQGIVYVNFNYRVNVFGFLAHPDLTKESEHHSSGNYGVLDQIAALRWIQKNIAQFGGDPNNVTIVGQSAGSASVGMQLVTPLSKGLFKGAIAQSGGVDRAISLAQGEQMGLKVAESLGAHSIAELRAKPASEVVKARPSISQAVVEGWVLPEDPVDIYRHGHQNDVPMICGSTADDGPSPVAPTKASEVPAYAKAQYGDLADEYMKLFPATTDALAKKAEHDVRSYRYFYSARLWVNLAAATGHSKVFWYLFSQRAPVPPDSLYDGKAPAEVGAYHGVDNNYTFDNLRGKDWPWTDADRKFAQIVSGMWVQFVKTGDPNGPGLPNWELYNPKNPRLLNIIAPMPNMEPGPFKTEADFFEKAAAKTGRRPN